MQHPEYNIITYCLAQQLTPIALRKTGSVWQLLTDILLWPVSRLISDCRSFIYQKQLRMDHNGQVRLLERIINLLLLTEYDVNDPLIYLDEPEPVNDFLISPDGNWADQGLIHYDQDGKDHWDSLNGNPLEAPDQYSILHDRSGHASGLGFEVHISWPLNPDAAYSLHKSWFYENGGEPALRGIVDTYKLAGKRYTVVWDEQ